MDIENNLLADNKILKHIASNLRNYRAKDQELVGHPTEWKESECWSQMGLAGTRFGHLVVLGNSGLISSSVRQD